MKIKTMLIVATLLIPFGVMAQPVDNTDFIFLNNSWNINNHNYSGINLYYPNVQMFRRNKDYHLSIQYVKNLSTHKALRLSLGYKEHYFNSISESSFVDDTLSFNYQSLATFLPYIGVGKEWRKQLHKDVAIVAGADIHLGLGGTTVEDYKFIQYTDSSGTYNQSSYLGANTQNTGIAVYASLIPFTGIRVSWGRLAMGYNVSLPYQLNTATYKGSPTTELDLAFQHMVSMGYSIYNKRKIVLSNKYAKIPTTNKR